MVHATITLKDDSYSGTFWPIATLSTYCSLMVTIPLKFKVRKLNKKWESETVLKKVSLTVNQWDLVTMLSIVTLPWRMKVHTKKCLYSERKLLLVWCPVLDVDHSSCNILVSKCSSGSTASCLSGQLAPPLRHPWWLVEILSLEWIYNKLDLTLNAAGWVNLMFWMDENSDHVMLFAFSWKSHQVALPLAS